MNQDKIIEQIDSSIKKYNDARIQAQYDDLSDQPESLQSEILTNLAATIDRIAPVGSRYHTNSKSALEKYGTDNPYNLEILVGILKALRADYIAGYFQTVQELIHADIFSDFLEMAEYLLDKEYKDPSAVLIGGVLEEHLRKLCQKNNISTISNDRPKKADAMNTELYTKGIYSKLDQKNVTAWLDLRNKSAHGQYDEYTKEQVNLMLMGVRDFLTRFTA